MKCPYTVNRHVVQQTSYEYDSCGNTVMNQLIEHNTAEFVECLKEQCGAWYDGRCRYNQAD